jgi:hypothetical protein
MAGIDYYSCDMCKAKTFYDACLNYRTPTGGIKNFHPVTYKPWPAGNVGWMTVLCKECVEEFRVEVVREDSSDG